MGSTNTLEGILHSIYNRYIVDKPPLPNLSLLAKFINRKIPTVAKSQVLYVYICLSDDLIKDTILSLLPSGFSLTNFVLRQKMILEFIEQQSKLHTELYQWSDSL